MCCGAIRRPRARERARRADQWARVHGWIQARNAVVAKQPRCEPESSLRGAQARYEGIGWARWVSVRLEGRQVVVDGGCPGAGKEAQLDGCYVVESDLPVAAATTQAVHDRYLGFDPRCERDFRTLKTGLLEIRPVFLRKADLYARPCAGELVWRSKLAREYGPAGGAVGADGGRRGGAISEAWRSGVPGEAKLGLWRLGGRLSGGADPKCWSFAKSAGAAVCPRQSRPAGAS